MSLRREQEAERNTRREEEMYCKVFHTFMFGTVIVIIHRGL